MGTPEIKRSCCTCYYGYENGRVCPQGYPVCTHSNGLYKWRHLDDEEDEPTNPAPDEGIKYDTSKPRYSLVPPEALDGLARLYTKGATKYDARNWEKGMNWSRLFDALQRHSWAWFSREDHCPQDGQHHLLSVIWSAMALYTYQVRDKGTDDRPWPGGAPLPQSSPEEVGAQP